VLESGKQPVSVPALVSRQVFALDFAERISDANRRDLVFVCELVHEHQRLALNVATFAPDKHLTLADPDINVDLSLEADVLALTVTASSLARFVELSFIGVDVVFSDNYFDLPAGRTVTVTCALPDGWSAEQARQALRVRSLYDSYLNGRALEQGPDPGHV
jgi:beta-mannosidase